MAERTPARDLKICIRDYRDRVVFSIDIIIEIEMLLKYNKI